MIPRPKDSSWVKQAFMLPEKSITNEDMARRVLTTASFKFTDTTIGGNFAINAPPQFTRYADIKLGGRGAMPITGSTTKQPGPTLASENSFNASHGMGRFYSESIDDNAQHVVMRFGVPEFNSLTSFFGNFYDANASTLARTGKAGGIFYNAGKALGFVVALPFAPLVLGSRIIKFFSNDPPSKFYYLKPAMPLYWSAVNTMVNGIAVNMGIIPRVLTNEQKTLFNNPQEFSQSTLSAYQKLLPDIFSDTGQIDVYAVATRAQRLGNEFNRMVRDALDQGTNELTLRESMSELIKRITSGELKTPTVNPSIDKYISSYVSIAQNKPTSDKDSGAQQLDTIDAAGADGTVIKISTRKAYDGVADTVGGSDWASFFEGERRDGSQFVTFKVDYSGTASESFSNSTKESELSQKINSMSSSARSTRFNFAEGNIGGGALGDLIQGAVSSVKDFVTGALEEVHLSGLAAFAGSAFVDIPKTWDASTANLPRAEYTIELRSPYGNKLSRLTNLYIPLSMLLAGALPLGAGKHAYTSPFICELYCRGRTAIRLGMIDSLSITRGTGNLGWSQDGEPLGIDVSFSVVDLSSIMHMPIAAAFSAKDALLGTVASAAASTAGLDGDAAFGAVLSGSYDDDNSYTDYLAVLGSLSWVDMVYTPNKWALNLTNQLAQFRTWKSASHWANWTMGTLPGRVINALSLGTDRTD